MVDGWIELCDELKEFRSYRTLQVRKHRGSAMLRGKHAFRITPAGLAVFPRIESTLTEQASSASRPGRVSTGVDSLDGISGGGFPEASATLLIGPTGAGKTTLGLQFVAKATPQEPALLLGFYESPDRLHAKASAIGLDLEAACESGALHIMWRPPSENLVDEMAWQLVDRAKAVSARRVFVDGIVAWRNSLIFPERLPHVLNALNLYLRQLGATTVYTSEIREMTLPDRLPTDDVSLVVDNVLLMSYVHRHQAPRRSLTLIKLRDSGFDPLPREFEITHGGIAIGPDPTLQDHGPEAD